MQITNGLILRQKKGNDMGAMFNLGDINTITWIDDRFDSGKYFVTVHVKESKFQEKMNYKNLANLLQTWADFKGEKVEINPRNVGGLNKKRGDEFFLSEKDW